MVIDIDSGTNGRLPGTGSRASAGSVRMMFLASALLITSLALLAIEVFANAAGRKPAAPGLPLRYDAATGVTVARHEALVQFRTAGRALTCTYMSARSPAMASVACPNGYGAIAGACGDADPGDILVTWRGTGWSCPERAPGKNRAASVGVLCCKY